MPDEYGVMTRDEQHDKIEALELRIAQLEERLEEVEDAPSLEEAMRNQRRSLGFLE